MNAKDCVAMILAGGRGSRLHDLTNKVAMDTVAAGESAQMAELLADGAFAVNGQPVSQEELNEALIKTAEEQIAELERTMDAQIFKNIIKF